jgi:hypothetical protein
MLHRNPVSFDLENPGLRIAIFIAVDRLSVAVGINAAAADQ